MFTLVNKLLQLAVVVALLVLVVLLWRPARGLAIALASMGAVMAALTVLVQRKRRALQGQLAGAPAGAPIFDDERGARLLVTQLLGELTRTQVAYLRQSFETPKAGRDWLKRVLPRSYRVAFDQLYADLEAARGGKAPHSLRLAERILELHRSHLTALESNLKAATAEHPKHAIAHPIAFVVTENIDAGRADSEPELHSVAGWDPREPTLLPTVDFLTVFGQGKGTAGKPSVRGQISFAAATSALASRLTPIMGSGAKRVYAAEADEAGLPDLAVEPIPLGFVIGGAELA